ncbi:MAG: C_GCAxxG_C_C family protein [Oscillospiraceae bacterium]|nr:C_GCAxxG_C_C family protein [Oscillospiraceae bacterium]
MDHKMLAAELFTGGLNCAQAVAAAFSDVTGFSREQSAKMISAFGGGMGRMREVCGAVSGMFFVLGTLYGYDHPDQQAQMALYAKVQALAEKFRQETGSIVCREILKNPPTDPKPTPRTSEFYAKRPCTYLVILAASLLDEFIAENPIA